MTASTGHLRLVPREDEPVGSTSPLLGDLALIAALFLVSAAPLLGELARVGRWSPGTLGLSAAGSLLAGRELCAELLALFRGGS